MLNASTASPYKFTNAVLTALEQPVDGIDDLAQIKRLFDLTNFKVPRNLSDLAKAKILHTDVCDKDDMAERVLTFAAK